METISKEKRHWIEYINMIIFKFASSYKLPVQEAYRYLKQYGSIDFLNEFYDVEHTEKSLLYCSDTVKSMSQSWRNIVMKVYHGSYARIETIDLSRADSDSIYKVLRFENPCREWVENDLRKI
jgi:hypothetical protein